MAKVTSKLQVTIPKRVADAFGIAPGDDIEFVASADSIRILHGAPSGAGGRAERLELFDRATARQRVRQRQSAHKQTRSKDRGWARDELYDRARAR